MTARDDRRKSIRRLIRCALAGTAALAATAAAAQPAPNSVRAEEIGGSIILTWDAGTAPYGVYRSTAPQTVVDPANFTGVTLVTTYEDPVELQPAASVLYFRVDQTRSCNATPDCDNGNPCDGPEDCVSLQCEPGIATFCNDNDACTFDRCDPLNGSCGSTPLDCDDGDSCTLDRCVAGLGCESTVNPFSGIGIAAEIAGNPLGQYPFFEFARSYNEDATVSIAIDPARQPDLVGKTCDVYLMEARSARDWCFDRTLTDVRGAPDVRSFVAGTVQNNVHPLIAPFQVSADAGATIGRGYDVAIDCDRDGFLDFDEPADGLSDRAGLYLLHDLTRPGPFATTQFDRIGPAPDHCDTFFNPGNDDMRVYHPSILSDPTFGERFPLVLIGHGNGHCFDWYDFLGHHLASYGYIVGSYDNDTGPGIENASETTLLAPDRVLANQDTLGGGILNGHIDGERMAWIGHSRGGEGVVRAYDRIVDEGYTPAEYTADDVVVISSIAPTDFLGPVESDPHDVNYHMLYGSSDGDVCGCPNSLYPFALYERATGVRHSTYVQGADHNDFNCCGFNDFAGPAATELGRTEVQKVQKAIQLATLERFVKGRLAAEDLFWRQYESFRPIGVANTTIVVNEYRKPPAGRTFVIEDFQTEPSLTVSSSGGAVDFSVANLVEDRMIDSNGSFTWLGTEPMNGMTRATNADLTRGGVFDYPSGANAFFEWTIVPAERDFTDDRWLSFRAAQGTRHPETDAAREDLVFTVTLIDGAANASSIRIDAWGGGIEEPYQRTGGGSGAGWQNEFETIRIRLTDFLANGSGLDLADVERVRFEFGSFFGSPEGRLGLDDIELTEE